MNGVLTMPLDGDDHVRGADGADLELVMYGDFQCPFCMAAQSVVARVTDRLGDRLRYAFRHFPLPGRHPQALTAAQAAESAAAGGDFWAVHDALFAGQPRMRDDAAVLAILRDAGFDADRVRSDLTSGVWLPRVESDLATGVDSDVTGTPGFIVNGVLHGGSYNSRSLVDALKAGDS